MWDLEGNMLEDYKTLSSPSKAIHLAFNNDGNSFATTGSVEKNIKIWMNSSNKLKLSYNDKHLINLKVNNLSLIHI